MLCLDQPSHQHHRHSYERCTKAPVLQSCRLALVTLSPRLLSHLESFRLSWHDPTSHSLRRHGWPPSHTISTAGGQVESNTMCMGRGSDSARGRNDLWFKLPYRLQRGIFSRCFRKIANWLMYDSVVLISQSAQLKPDMNSAALVPNSSVSSGIMCCAIRVLYGEPRTSWWRSTALVQGPHRRRLRDATPQHERVTAPDTRDQSPFRTRNVGQDK